MTKTEAIKRMVNEVVAYQEQQALTDQALADELGVPRSTWTSVRLGNFIPGRNFAAQVAKVPRFADVALKALTS